MNKEVISTRKIPSLPGAPYSPAARARVGGQIPNDLNADISLQTRQTLEKIKALVEEAGAILDNVVKTIVYLTDLDDYDSMNEVYREFFRENPPSRACVKSAALVRGCRMEIEAIAFVP